MSTKSQRYSIPIKIIAAVQPAGEKETIALPSTIGKFIAINFSVGVKENSGEENKGPSIMISIPIIECIVVASSFGSVNLDAVAEGVSVILTHFLCTCLCTVIGLIYVKK